MNSIYCLKNPINNDIVYIGKSKNVSKRYKDHCRKAKGKYRCKLDKWKNELISSGNLPVLEIIEQFDEYVDINFWEKYYISLYRSWGFNLLNMTEGGDGLQNPSIETRNKIGDKSRGRKFSKETLKALSEIRYNKGKKIKCYDIELNFVGEYINARRASEELNVSYKLISQIVSGVKHFSNNYTFFLSDELDIQTKLLERKKKTIKHGKEFIRLNKNGEKKVYTNVVLAGKENNINFRNIWLCLKKERKTAGGYQWFYFEN